MDYSYFSSIVNEIYKILYDFLGFSRVISGAFLRDLSIILDIFTKSNCLRPLYSCWNYYDHLDYDYDSVLSHRYSFDVGRLTFPG